MSAAQAATALGVRLGTVYAYVSRGVLTRTSTVDDAGHRHSHFDRAEVLRLAELRRRPGAGLRVLVESDVTRLDAEGRLAFRGLDLVDVVALGRFEDVVAHLWQRPPARAWRLAPAVDAALDAAAPWLHGVEEPTLRLRAALTVAGSVGAGGEGEDAVHEAARQALMVGVRALGGAGAGAGDDLVAALGTGLTGRALGDADHRLLTAALSVLVDHELSASTVAARIAAGLRADPWSCLLAGLQAMSGQRQAGSVRGAGTLLASWLDGGPLPEAPLPGFGHVVYERSDPRADLLLDELADVDPPLHAAVVDLTVEVAREHSTFCNIDLALAAVGRHLGLPPAVPSALFLLARIPGLAAHVVEELPHDLRFRPRSV